MTALHKTFNNVERTKYSIIPFSYLIFIYFIYICTVDQDRPWQESNIIANTLVYNAAPYNIVILPVIIIISDMYLLCWIYSIFLHQVSALKGTLSILRVDVKKIVYTIDFITGY